MTSPWDFLGPFCKDHRVYSVVGLANAVLAGNDLTAEHRERLKDYPNVLALLDWMAEKRKDGLKQVHATPGPQATPETFSREWLRSLNEPREAREEIALEDL